MVLFVVTTCRTYICSDKLIPFTQLTKVGAIFAFKRCGISCMLQVVTTNHIV